MAAAASTRRAPREGHARDSERERILDAAESLFAERGFADTRMQDIASAARASLRSVYAVAKGKVKIFRALHERRGEDLLARMREVLSDEGGDPAESLMGVIAVVATFLMDHPDFLRIQLREGRAWALDDHDVPLDRERHVSDRLLEGLFRRGIRAGAFHEEDPRMMVASLRALEQVQLATWVSRRGRLSKRAATEAIQAHARRLFCR